MQQMACPLAPGYISEGIYVCKSVLVDSMILPFNTTSCILLFCIVVHVIHEILPCKFAVLLVIFTFV
jgi:hypothetical protein